MVKDKDAPPEVAATEQTQGPDAGALSMPGLSPEHAALLEQAGELVIGGRLYVKEPAIDTTGDSDA
jgi:hypothetical protein